MSLARLLAKLSTTMRTLHSVVVLLLLRRWLIVATLSTSSAWHTSSIGSSHGLSELLWLSFPLGQSTLSSFYGHISAHLLLIGRLLCIITSPLSLHEYLLMFIVNYSMSLAIKLFPLLLEYFIANPHMLLIRLRVEISLTAWAWRQIQLISLDESISSEVRPETSSSPFFKAGMTYLDTSSSYPAS